MKGEDRDPMCYGTSIAPTTSIPKNVAAAKAKVVGRYSGSTKKSAASLGDSSYSAKLGSGVPLRNVVHVLRRDCRNYIMAYDGRDKDGQQKYRYVAGIRHWYNLYLDLQFSSYYHEGSQKFPAVDSTLMTSKEFYQLAQRSYSALKAQARLNFAKVSPIGLQELVKRKLLLTSEQWGAQLNSRWELGKKLSDREALTQFYNSLTRDNQFNLQEALGMLAARSSEDLEVVLSSYDISSSDFDAICRMTKVKDIRFCNVSVDNASDLMAFFRKISPISRMAVFESSTFKHFQNNAQGILPVFLHREFPVEGYTYKEMLAFIDKHLDSSASDFLEKCEQVIAKFGLALIADHKHTIPAMDPGGDLEALHQKSPWLQKIIVECAKKKKFDDTVDQDGRAPFFAQVNDMSFASGSVEGDTLQFKPPSYEDLLVSARSFAESNPRIAVQTFCQAMNTHKEDDAESSRKQQKIAAILKRLQTCEQAIKEFDNNYERKRQIVEKAELAELDGQKVNLYQQRDRYIGQLNRARMMVVPLEERMIDPAVLKQATGLAKEQSMTAMYPRLIELYDRYIRQQMDNIDSLRDKGALFIKLSQREIERAYLIRESRSEYAVPRFVTSPGGLIELTEQYLEDASEDVANPQGQAVLNQYAQAWLYIARSAPAGHSISERALMYLIAIRGLDAYDDVLACLDAFPSGHDFVLTGLQRLFQLKGLEASDDVLSRLASFPQEASRASLKKATLMRLALTLAGQDGRHPSRAALRKCFVFPSSHASGCLGSLFYPPRRDTSFHRAFATALHDWDEKSLLSYLNTNVNPLVFEVGDLLRLRNAFPKPKPMPQPKPIVLQEPGSLRKKYLITGGVTLGLAAASGMVMALSMMNVITLPGNLGAVFGVGALILFMIAAWAFVAGKNEAPAEKLSDFKATVLGKQAKAPPESESKGYDVEGVPIKVSQLPTVERRLVNKEDDPWGSLDHLRVAQELK